MMTYNYLQDPGRGWLQVPMTEIRKLGLAQKISDCSFRKGGDAFLEEDCDMSLFIKALRTTGQEFKLNEVHTDDDSPVRSYSSFYP
jgi:hypothetical protein